MARLLAGGDIPLFDKLSQIDSGHDGRRTHVLSAAAAEQSVIRELGRLTNSRSRLTLEEFSAAELTVLDFGIPDYSARSAQSQADRMLIQQAVTKAITVFEPRLSAVDVELLQNPASKTVARYAIAGNLRIDNISQRISFEIALDSASMPVANQHAEPF